MIREKNRYYVTHNSRYSTGKVHKEACRWANQGNGFWVDKREDIPEFAIGTNDVPLQDCGVCGGRGPRP